MKLTAQLPDKNGSGDQKKNAFEIKKHRHGGA
jgi:hypothetical protein